MMYVMLSAPMVCVGTLGALCMGKGDPGTVPMHNLRVNSDVLPQDAPPLGGAKHIYCNVTVMFQIPRFPVIVSHRPRDYVGLGITIMLINSN